MVAPDAVGPRELPESPVSRRLGYAPIVFVQATSRHKHVIEIISCGWGPLCWKTESQQRLSFESSSLWPMDPVSQAGLPELVFSPQPGLF